jgi:hypothetical protein
MSFDKNLHGNFCYLYYQQIKNIKNKPIMDGKFRAWDTVEKQFFKPIYKRATINSPSNHVSELVLTQSGEVMHRLTQDGITTITHEIAMEFRNRYKINLRAGLKDKDNKKYYLNDIVKAETETKTVISKDRTVIGKENITGVLVWMGDQFGIGVGPIDDYTQIVPISKECLEASEIIGNIYMDRNIIMGIEPPEESNEDKLRNQLKTKGRTD